MSFLFGGDDAPAPAPVPDSPSAVSNEAAQRERQAASDRALAETRAAGRRQTVSAGREIAADEQEVLGTDAKKRRAARDIVGE